jgi:hypothetical protein
MSPAKPVKVVQMKKSPPIWSIKVGARYLTGFVGNDAKERAFAFATSQFGEFEMIAKPTTKREQARLDAIAGLSDAT